MPMLRFERNEEKEPRRLIRTRELMIIFTVLVVCIGFWVARQKDVQTGATAVIQVNGALAWEVTLRTSDDYRIDMQGTHGVPVSFEVKAGGIRFVDVTCPDHICEKTGFVSTDGQTAVCMPNKTSVTIITE